MDKKEDLENKEEVKEKKKKVNLTVCGVTGFAFSLATIIFVILSFVFVYLSTAALAFSISTIVVSSIGVHISKQNKKEGKDFSNFGMSLGVILFIVSLTVFIFWLTTFY